MSTNLSNSNAVPEFSSTEDLEAFLENQSGETSDEVIENGTEEGQGGKPETQKQKAPEPKKETKVESPFNQSQKPVEKKEETTEEDEEEENQETTDEDAFPNMLAFLNEQHSLNLNLSALPE